MLRITLSPRWLLHPEATAVPDGSEDVPALDGTDLLALLAAVQECGSLAQAARTVGLSYRHAWGRLKQGEALFGRPLLVGGRGRGSTLTEWGLKLIWAHKRVGARLSPLLQSLASELEGDLQRSGEAGPAMLRLNASHGFAVAALVGQLQAAGVPVDLRYRSSLESVAALARGECDMAGFHVPVGEFQGAAADRYRCWLRPQSHRLVQLAVRTQGLFVAPGNPHRIASLADLRRPALRFVNRPEGSGTRVLIELMLHKLGVAPAEVNGWGDTELTHAAVAAYIASGMADAGVGVQTAAQRFGLGFIPLLRERYYFALRADAMSQAPLQPVLERLRTPACRAAIAALAGYDASETGRVLAVDEALGAG